LEREAITKARVNWNLFRSIILSSHAEKCAVCRLPISSLLVATHIVPWSIDPNVRMNPCNGICLSSLHDRAFDRGLLNIDADHQIRMRDRRGLQ
jgi:putative restriction endonuclease